MFSKLKKITRIWRESVRHEKSKPKSNLNKTEVEFLPAVVELLETPVSPIGHAVVFLIIGLFVVTIAWASFGRIDMVAVAQGRIIPGGNVKIVQTFESGVVDMIYVKDGQRVKQGELLIKLDPLDAEVDIEKLNAEHRIASLEIVRLETLLLFLDDGFDDFESRITELDLPPSHQRQLLNEIKSHISELLRIDGERKQLQAQLHATDSNIKRFKTQVPLSAKHEAALLSLLAKNVVPHIQWVIAKKELVDLEHGLKAAQHRQNEIKLAIDGKEKERTALLTNTRHDTLTKLKDQRNSAELTALNLRKANKRQTRNNLTAPVDGTVQQLSVHTIGGVVKAADPLMIIVPDNSQLVVEASVLNKDIGFVEVGQAVAIKIESFPFTKYGLIDGEIVNLSADAVANETLGLVYTMRASLARSSIIVNQKEVPLSPGMVATAEIKIGDRAAIEFFLAPLLKSRQEVFKER